MLTGKYERGRVIQSSLGKFIKFVWQDSKVNTFSTLSCKRNDLMVFLFITKMLEYLQYIYLFPPILKKLILSSMIVENIEPYQLLYTFFKWTYFLLNSIVEGDKCQWFRNFSNIPEHFPRFFFPHKMQSSNYQEYLKLEVFQDSIFATVNISCFDFKVT